MKQICLFLYLLLCLQVLSQNEGEGRFVVKGNVVDVNKEPVIGVTIQLKGTLSGTVTDVNGNYRIQVPKENAILVFSYLGYETKEVVVKGNLVDVTLIEVSKDLDEVVVVGYGVSKKRDLTGAISSISSASIEERIPVNAFEALQGQVAGVEIVTSSGEPGANAEVRVRGTATFEAGAKPLYVVDGVPYDDIDDINPNDIESIEVLKDAASAAIYGSRSANGVFLITTKKGEKTNPRLDIRYLNSYSQLARKMPKANAADRKYYDIIRGQYRPNYTFVMKDSLSNFHNQDWDLQDLLFRTAAKNQIDLSTGGASESLSYYLSAGYLNESGIIINSNYNRFTTRINTEYKPTKKLSLGSKVQMSYTDKNGISESGVLTELLQRIPYWAIFEPDGSYVINLSNRTNPYAVAMDDTHRTQTYKVSAYEYLDYTFNKNWKFSTNIQANYYRYHYQNYRPKPQVGTGQRTTGKDDGSESLNWMNENYITYDNTFNKVHKVNAMIGCSFQSSHKETANMLGYDYTTDEIYTLNAASAFDTKGTKTFITESSMASFFGRVGYNYKSKYLLNINMRYDGSSRFGVSNRWGAFPSASLGWRFSSEKFVDWMKPFVSDAKLRLSYGVTGNEAIGDYDSQLLYAPDFIYNGLSGISATNMAYEDLSWEQTVQYNAGLDLRIFKNRINIIVDLYKKDTDRLLNWVQLPKETGFAAIRRNIGSMSNEGVEFSFDYKILRTKKWNWSANFNISTNKSTITKIADNIPFYKGAGNAIYIQENHRLGEFYGYKQLRIFSYDESNNFTSDWQPLTPVFENGVFQNKFLLNGEEYTGQRKQKYDAAGNLLKGGDIDYEDLDGDGMTTVIDKQLIGCAQPDFFGGFSTTIGFRNFSVFLSLYYSFGGDIYNYAANLQTTGTTSDALTPRVEAIHNMWAKPGDIASYPRPDAVDHNLLQPNDLYVEDGSYVRLRNVKLNYTLPSHISKKVFMKKATVYVYGNNLLTWTDYSGFDPEFNTGSDPLSIGIDTNRYPRKKEFGFGLNLNF